MSRHRACHLVCNRPPPAFPRHPSRGRPPRAPLRRRRALPGCEPLRRTAAACWGRHHRRGWRPAGGARRAKMPCILPILPRSPGEPTAVPVLPLTQIDRSSFPPGGRPEHSPSFLSGIVLAVAIRTAVTGVGIAVRPRAVRQPVALPGPYFLYLASRHTEMTSRLQEEGF
jgi:hypothetical protein